ncbi:DUF4181 domain-containing protein [Lysinibacillus macroides]|uniref:DUF4181 domain-containing protein n=1 Tax=Lysinibacillus macroides TaxID=33935 RepID=A0A0M9DI75_9BACI|nr:DUF4181 domain-containing protein [Lysinibacillus macroides]KOY81399.1 hypothetical protein ADM90_19965 [Lysinibacillus macroides]QPR68427.1 DUF4181 domain-containing protein [Lysinibacillus macroides]
MTAFKNKLDKELGEAPRFSKALQKDILEQARQNKQSTKNWQYPIIMAGAIVLFFLLIITEPFKQTDNGQQASVIELAQQHEITMYTVAQNGKETSFQAGRPGWVIGQDIFKTTADTEVLQQLLQQATATQVQEYDLFGFNTMDIWVAFESGQAVKLKIMVNDQQLLLKDYTHQSVYLVNDPEMIATFLVHIDENKKEFTMGNLFTFLIVLLLGTWLIEKLVRKKFNIPKGYANTAHQRATRIIKICNTVIPIMMLLTNWFLYTAVIGSYLIITVTSSIFIDYHYGREEKRHYLSIAWVIIAIPALILLLMYI